jgi:hypothetical protein
MRTPTLRALLDELGAALTAAAFAEENEAATAREIFSGGAARRRLRSLRETPSCAGAP